MQVLLVTLLEIGLVPARALEAKASGRNHAAKFRITALGAIRERRITHAL